MAASLVPTEGGNSITLDKPIMLIGRHQECDISLQSSSKISRRHCCIVQVGDRYVLRDLGSMNGIRVNGHRVVETDLMPEDEIAVADINFRFRRDDIAQRPRSAQAVRPQRNTPPDDVSHGIPVALPEEEIHPANRSTPLPNPVLRGKSGEIRLKDDSQAEPEFVRV